MSSESLNLLLPKLVPWCIIMNQIVFQKPWFAVFKVKVTVKNHIIKIWLSVFWTADPFATKLGLVAHHFKLNCLVKRLDCFVVINVKVTKKVKNSSECSSGWYLLNCWTFCNQTWYGNGSSWARVSCEKSLRAHLYVVGMLWFMFLTETKRACPLLFILFLCLLLS